MKMSLDVDCFCISRKSFSLTWKLVRIIQYVICRPKLGPAHLLYKRLKLSSSLFFMRGLLQRGSYCSWLPSHFLQVLLIQRICEKSSQRCKKLPYLQGIITPTQTSLWLVRLSFDPTHCCVYLSNSFSMLRVILAFKFHLKRLMCLPSTERVQCYSETESIGCMHLRYPMTPEVYPHSRCLL